MKLKDFSLFILFWLFAMPALAQYQISGTITDRITGEVVEGVEIYDNEAGRSYRTDEDGYFEIDGLQQGTYNIYFYILGYEIIHR